LTLKIKGTTNIYGIIGNPVRHTLSPAMHNAAFAAMEMDSVYIPMEVTDISQAVAGLRALGIKGVSVTVPHKETIIPYIDKADDIAAKIGAVNTLLLRQNPDDKSVIVEGYNTDWIGANRALNNFIQLKDITAMIIGAGGAAKALGFGLIEAGAKVIIANRTEKTGLRLAAQINCDFIQLNELKSVRANVLINTTSVGMTPDSDKIIVDPALLPQFEVVMDIVYSPLQTKLLREAAKAGCTTIDGLHMLLYQGMAQFELWTGVKAPEDVMRQALERKLKNR